jgi:hypothetical protein
VICVVHVDDIIFWNTDTDTTDINSSATQLRELGVDLDMETTSEGFLESRWNGIQKQVCLI